MRHVRYHSHGGPEVLAIEEASIPEPGPGQVLIRTEAIGVNYVDVQLRRETDPDSIYFRQLPATLTGDVVGTVSLAGAEADPALVGRRVAVLHEDAYAEYVVADISWLVNVPDGMDAGVASMLPTVGAVALGTLHAGRVREGETVLISSGAGAIGHLAVQLAKLRGAGTVIATAGSAAKLSFVKELGADLAVDHCDAGWVEQVRSAVPGGIDVALEAVGGAFLHQCVGTLAPFGRVVVYGAAAGDLTSVPVTSVFALKTISGFSLLAWRAAASESARADIASLTELFETGALRAVCTQLPLTDVVEAHRLLESRAVHGRLILVP